MKPTRRLFATHLLDRCGALAYGALLGVVIAGGHGLMLAVAGVIAVGLNIAEIIVRPRGVMSYHEAIARTLRAYRLALYQVNPTIGQIADLGVCDLFRFKGTPVSVPESESTSEGEAPS